MVPEGKLATVTSRDPRLVLVRLLARLEARAQHVTLADLEREAARRRSRTLPPEQVAPLVEAAVADMLILTDRRLFLDRVTQSFEPRSVYRVNRRHPLGREVRGA